MDPTIVSHLLIAALNLATAWVTWHAGKRAARDGPRYTNRHLEEWPGGGLGIAEDGPEVR